MGHRIALLPVLLQLGPIVQLPSVQCDSQELRDCHQDFVHRLVYLVSGIDYQGLVLGQVPFQHSGSIQIDLHYSSCEVSHRSAAVFLLDPQRELRVFRVSEHQKKISFDLPV